MIDQEEPRLTDRPTKDVILDAALALFSEKGFDSATMKEIAAKAKVNEVTIYRIFGTKDELFESVIASRFPHDRISMEVHFDRNVPPEAALLENAKTILRILKEEREIFIILSSDLPRRKGSGILGQSLMMNSFIVPIRAYLSNQMEKGSLRPADHELAAQALFGMIYSYFVLNYILGRNEVSAQEEGRRLQGIVQIFLTGTAKASEGVMVKDIAKKPSK